MQAKPLLLGVKTLPQLLINPGPTAKHIMNYAQSVFDEEIN
jgi:hypothetical protein